MDSDAMNPLVHYNDPSVLSLYQYEQSVSSHAVEKALLMKYIGGNTLGVVYECPQILDLGVAPSEAADNSVTVTAQATSDNEKPWSGQSLTEERCPAVIFSEKVAKAKNHLKEFEKNFRVDQPFTVADNPTSPVTLMSPTGSYINPSAELSHHALLEGVVLHADVRLNFQTRNTQDVLDKFEESFSGNCHAIQRRGMCARKV